jgi:hypothetical protein
MSSLTETAPTPRSHLVTVRGATAFAVVALLSLGAVTSANARGFHSFHASHPARTFYSPSTSMIAAPMQQAPAIAPLSPRVNSGF